VKQTITSLVEAFETGEMTRRQLIRSLAIAATGAGALGSAEALAAATPVSRAVAFKTHGVDHIVYRVADYARSRDFYADLMGWEVIEDDGESEATLYIPGVESVMIIRNHKEGEAPAVSDREGPPVTGVIDHIGWSIEDFDADAVREELERRGLNPTRDRRPDGTYHDSFHVLDPDGFDCQIGKHW